LPKARHQSGIRNFEHQHARAGAFARFLACRAQDRHEQQSPRVARTVRPQVPALMYASAPPPEPASRSNRSPSSASRSPRWAPAPPVSRAVASLSPYQMDGTRNISKRATTSRRCSFARLNVTRSERPSAPQLLFARRAGAASVRSLVSASDARCVRRQRAQGLENGRNIVGTPTSQPPPSCRTYRRPGSRPNAPRLDRSRRGLLLLIAIAERHPVAVVDQHAVTVLNARPVATQLGGADLDNHGRRQDPGTPRTRSFLAERSMFIGRSTGLAAPSSTSHRRAHSRPRRPSSLTRSARLSTTTLPAEPQQNSRDNRAAEHRARRDAPGEHGVGQPSRAEWGGVLVRSGRAGTPDAMPAHLDELVPTVVGMRTADDGVTVGP
jgi:hypothetical protein